MASPARPTDELLIEAARAHVTRLCGPGKAPRLLVLHVEGVPDPITLPVLSPCCSASAPAESSRTFAPNAFQDRICDALAGKLLTAEQLGEAVGDRRKLFRPGGVRELMEAGWVRKRPGGGYYMPDDPPDGLAENS